MSSLWAEDYKMKCPKCKGKGYLEECLKNYCLLCEGTGKVERSDGIDYNRKIAVPEHKANHEKV